MTATPSERFRVVRAVFEAVVELPAAARPQALDERCAGDPALRHEVERLLLADSDADQIVSPQRLAAGIVGSDPLGAQACGTRIGEFTVQRLLGSGGMGAVYEAEQAQPKRLVALKVLRPELCTGRTVRRFQVEADILGRLQHPGIAEVFAAGVHRAEAGPFRWDMPYYAMELLVAARPITIYAREHELALPARLDLMVKVCEAVHHAHQRGVIHRDLKPGNILVDASAAPKVIDFGVARATDHDPLLTATGVLVGTPSYMAPEQMAGGDIDVRTDVWALGVLLYEISCGRLPYLLEGRAPATVAAALASPPPSPRSLCTQVSVELEWILLKALAHERERRYQTAAELAADLGRLRRHESVLAVPPSRAYRLRKTIRRHRTLTVASTVAFICLAGGLVATGLALRRAWHAEAEAAQSADAARTAAAAARGAEIEARAAAERAQAEKANAERARADAEATTATALASKRRTEGLLELVQSAVLAASRRGGGRDITLAQFWEQVATRVDSDESLPELTRAAAFNYLGSIRFHSGDAVAAEALFRRSLGSLEAASAMDSREEILGRGALSEALRVQGRLAESERELQTAIDIAKRTLDDGDGDALSLRRRWAFVLLNHGRADEAVAVCRALLAARLVDPGAESRLAAEARADLATALLVSGDHAAAEAEARLAHAACAHAFGAGTDKTVNVANTLTLALLHLDRAAAAEATARPALESANATLGPRHPVTRAIHRSLATALRQRGDATAAVAEFRACLQDALDAGNAGRREVLATVSGLGEALLLADQPDAVLATTAAYVDDLPEEALPVQVELCGVQRVRARALVRLGRADEALALVAGAEVQARARLGGEHAAHRQLVALRQEIERSRAR